MSLGFFATSLVVVLIPGTGVINTLSVALAQGRSKGLVASVACTLGIVPHLVAAAFGLSGFLHAGAVAFQILKYAGVAYLLFLAVSMLRAGGTASLETNRPAANSAVVIRRGILLNLLNPKLTIFFFAFLPQFTSTSASTGSLLGLWAVFMALTLVVFAGYATIAASLRGLFANDSKARDRVQRSMAALLAAFAIKLAFSDR